MQRDVVVVLAVQGGKVMRVAIATDGSDGLDDGVAAGVLGALFRDDVRGILAERG